MTNFLHKIGLCLHTLGGVDMLAYEDMRRFTKLHDLVVNRVNVINQITDGACTMGGRGCDYVVRFYGRPIAQWQAYDVASVERSLSAMDAVYDVLWDCRRLGYASFP